MEERVKWGGCVITITDWGNRRRKVDFEETFNCKNTVKFRTLTCTMPSGN